MIEKPWTPKNHNNCIIIITKITAGKPVPIPFSGVIINWVINCWIESNPAKTTISFITENTVMITKNGIIDKNELNTIGGTCPGNLIVNFELTSL